MIAALYATVIGVPLGDGIYVWEVVEAPIYFLLDPYLLLRIMWGHGRYVE